MATAWAKVGVGEMMRSVGVRIYLKIATQDLLLDCMRDVGETEESDLPHHW